MKTVGFDTESHPIKPGLLAPRMVCLSWCADGASGLMLRDDGVAWLRRQLADPSVLLAAHNLPFDLGVACAEAPDLLPLVFDAYREGRLCCTIVRQQLLDVALGMRKWRRAGGKVTRATYGLVDLVALYHGEHLEKADTWRLHYAELDGVPVDEWPAEARDYAVRDAVEVVRLREAQGREMEESFGGPLPNEAEQQRAAFALHLMSMWGLRADPVAAEHFISRCEEQVEVMHRALAETVILKPDGSRTMAEIRRRVVESMARKRARVPRTKPTAKHPDGQVKTDEDTLRLTDDPHLHALADAATFQKHLGQWGPVVRAAVNRPVCCRYNVLVDNGRSSCSGSEGQEGTNIQNPPRKGDVRPCFIPRVGWLYCSTDADTIEMRANAQNALEMVGWSRMAEALHEQHSSGGPDLHVCLAANVAGIDRAAAQALHKGGDVSFKNVRQMSKHGNFAFLGGAGARRFARMAHGFGICLTESSDHMADFSDACPVFAEGDDGKMTIRWVSWEAEVACASSIKRVWLETWPEEREIFRIVEETLAAGSTARQLMSGRIRGDLTYTSLANTFFSGRVADAEKEILFNLAEECYAGRCTSGHRHGGDQCTASGRSVLYGSRPVMFLHDEPILEHPEDGSESDRAERQRVVNVEGLSRWMPDVPCTSSAVLMRRWQKGAEPLKINGKLVPVKPQKVVGSDGKKRVTWVHDQRAA